MSDTLCFCCSGKPFEECCKPVLEGTRGARTPEELIRARFSAHCQHNYPFLVESTHPDHRKGVSIDEIRTWADHVDWTRLEVHSATPGATDDEGSVSFTAHYTVRGIEQELREDSEFARLDGKWYYVDGAVHGHEPYEREAPRVGRNDPCPCGSGKKYKKCCGN